MAGDDTGSFLREGAALGSQDQMLNPDEEWPSWPQASAPVSTFAHRPAFHTALLLTEDVPSSQEGAVTGRAVAPPGGSPCPRPPAMIHSGLGATVDNGGERGSSHGDLKGPTGS